MSRIDQLFREKAADFKPEGAAPGWEQFKAHSTAADQKKPKTVFWWGIAAGLALVLLAGWWIAGSQQQEQVIADKPQATDEVIEAPAPVFAKAVQESQKSEAELAARQELAANITDTQPSLAKQQSAPKSVSKQALPTHTVVNEDALVAQHKPAPEETSTEEMITDMPAVTVVTVALEIKPAELSLASNELNIQTITIAGVESTDSTSTPDQKGLLARLKGITLGDIREAKDELFARATAIEVSNPLKNSK